MAGSYNHLIGEGCGWNLIENMGDAYECVEQLFWLVERGVGRAQAEKLLQDEWYPMCRGEMPDDPHRQYVQRQMENAGC